MFGDKCTQRGIYDTCAAPIVNAAMEGFNGTIFMYGQTGAGKTFTMQVRDCAPATTTTTIQPLTPTAPP